MGDPANNTVGRSSEEDDKRYFRSLPQGYRFRPKDGELVVKYLKREVEKTKPLPRNNIRRIDIYKHTPQQLCQRDEGYRENEWYFFFSPRDRKYPKGRRPTRQAAGGFWKPTGVDKDVVHKGSVVGYRKSLDYHEGHVKNNQKRTDWKMHEYRILQHPQPLTNTNTTAPPNNMEMQLGTVLCKIYRKTNAKKEDKNDDDIDHQNTLHFNNEQQQPPPPLQTVAEPYNSYGGALGQSLAIDIPTLFSTTDNFVIHENGGQEDGTLQNSVQSSGDQDYYHHPPSTSVTYEGFDELSSVFGGRRLRYGADKNI